MLSYTVISKSLVLSGSKIAKPGDVLPASTFKGKEKQLAILLREGVLERGEIAEVQQLDIQRADVHLPAIPVDTDANGQKVVSSKFQSKTGNYTAAQKKLDQIKASQKMAPAKSGASKTQLLTPEERQVLLEMHAGQNLSIEDAKALGLVS